MSAADPPDRPSPPAAPPGRDAVDLALAEALRAAPSVPVALANEPDDDAILRVLEGRADPVERARVEAAPLAAEKLAILRDLLAP